jgi:hypothetical protein
MLLLIRPSRKVRIAPPAPPPTIWPIIPLLQGRAFGPEDIKVMSTAFEGALNALGLMDRADALNELVAKKIIEIAKTGERNPSRLRDRALKSLQS